MIEKRTYSELAEEAWERAWSMLQTVDGWEMAAGRDPHHGCVYARHFNKHGKVFKLVATLDFSRTEVFDALVPGVEEWPKWNPTILECKMIERINSNTDISYSVGASAAGGLVSSRDFVNLRHWKERDSVLMSAACHVDHPSMPATKKHVRAENKPACYVFENDKEHPGKCLFSCLLCTDLKGWMPQFLIDQALSGVLMDYLKHLKRHLSSKRAVAGPSLSPTIFSNSSSTQFVSFSH